MKPNARLTALVAGLAAAALISGATTTQKVQKPTDLKPGASCYTGACHADLKKAKQVHGPVGDGDCLPCHTQADKTKHAFKPAATGPKLCETCHDPVEKKKSLHQPVTEDCVTCHSPHGSDEKAYLAMPLTELCGTCHDKQVAEAKLTGSVHSQVLKGKACLLCHLPHASPAAKLLTAEPAVLCLTCHKDPVKTGDRTIASVAEQLKAPFVHGPVKDKDCLACHVGHGSKEGWLLKAAYPRTFYAPFTDKTYALCFQCHEDTLVKKAQTDDATEFRNGTQNLHTVHVNDPAKGRTCGVCHSAHAGPQAAQVRPTVPFGRNAWPLPIRFTKTATGGSCATGCHLPRTYDRKAK